MTKIGCCRRRDQVEALPRLTWTLVSQPVPERVPLSLLLSSSQKVPDYARLQELFASTPLSSTTIRL